MVRQCVHEKTGFVIVIVAVVNIVRRYFCRNSIPINFDFSNIIVVVVVIIGASRRRRRRRRVLKINGRRFRNKVGTLFEMLFESLRIF